MYSEIAYRVETTRRSSWVGQETDDGSWGVERFLGFLGRKAEGRRACLEVMDSQDFEALRC